MSENKIGKKKHSKIKIASIVVAVLVAVFLLGTLLMNVIPTGYCVGVIVRMQAYDCSLDSEPDKREYEDVRGLCYETWGGHIGSHYHLTVLGLGGIKTADIDSANTTEAWGAINRFLTGKRNTLHVVKRWDTIVFKYEDNSISSIYSTFTHTPLTVTPTNPMARADFLMLLVAGTTYLILARKTKNPRLLTVLCIAISAVITAAIGIKIFGYFFFYRFDLKCIRISFDWGNYDGFRRYGMDWPGCIALGLAAVVFWILAYRYVINKNNEKKRKTSKIVLTVFVVCALSGLVIHNVINWQKLLTYDNGQRVAAPVIYLYPEEETEVNVKLDLVGEFTCTYPKYDEFEGWTCTALPNGMLTDEDGKEYTYLYWEADLDFTPDFSEGFCVKGEDTAEFLEEALTELGLNVSERNTFIMYWLPQMEANEYNLVSFQTSTYDNAAELNVVPEPDTVIRVNMAWYGVDEMVEIEPQDLTSFNPSEREGFTLVEWGGETVGE